MLDGDVVHRIPGNESPIQCSVTVNDRSKLNPGIVGKKDKESLESNREV